MLRLLALCILLLALPASAQEMHARMALPIAAGSVAAAACTLTEKFTIGTEAAANLGVGDYTTNDWMAFQYTTGADYSNVQRLTIRLKAVASDPAFTVTAYIWSNNATPDPDVPNAILTNGTSSNTISVSGTSYVDYNFTFSGVNMPTGTYWFGISTSGSSSTDYIHWSRGSYNAARLMHGSGDGTTWSLKTNAYAWLKLWNCE